MTTSESKKTDFFLQNESNRIDSNRELECSISTAILPNLLRLSMLRKPDVTSVVSQTVFVDDFVHKIVVNCALEIVFQLRMLTCLIV